MLGPTKTLVAAVIVALFGGFLLVAQPSGRPVGTVPGAETKGLPPVTGPAGNGLIAFSRHGDIYVGDPVTGESEAIVAGPEIETSPRFSPDGTHIAFQRVHAPDEAAEWEQDQDADWVVVRTDGSDERVLAPTEGIARGRGDFVWSPDGRSIFVTQAIAYGPQMTLFLLDANGVGDARPLPSAPSPWAFGGAQVASFFRPPSGDRLLVWDCCDDPDTNLLAVTDLDDSDVVDLGDLSGLDGMGWRWVGWSAWSPDASRILVHALTYDEPELPARDDLGVEVGSLYVMAADGSDLRRLTEGRRDHGFWPPAWSPDGSRIASHHRLYLEPGSTDERSPDGSSDHCTSPGWIEIIDVGTGAEFTLEASRLAAVPAADPADECPDVGGWSWSPDGRAVLLHWGPGTRPSVVDVASDTSTELPWESDSMPSWQRVAAD
jgi:dipeptidyl aminopeptidase/acylaminoacyl peptidase